MPLDLGALVMLPELPRRPSQRRLLVILDEADADSLQYEGWGELAHRKDVAVINADDELQDYPPWVSYLERRGFLNPGDVLVQNPYYTDRYEPISADAYDQFALDKFALFSRLCQRLGAQRVAAIAIVNVQTGEAVQLSGNIGKGPFKGGASANLSHLEKMAAKLHLQDTFDGSPPNLQAARELLLSHGLEHDTALSALVDSREYTANAHRSRELTVDLSTEANRSLKAALELSVPAYLKAQGNFSRTATFESKYSVTYKVTFSKH